MEEIYGKIASALVASKNIESNEEELYKYAIKITIHTLINTITTLLIGIVFGMLKECICFFLVFFILRKFTGGVHAKRYVNCFFSSVILIAISLCIIRLLQNNNYRFEFICVDMFSVVLICALSPVQNINRPLSSRENKIYRTLSIILSVFVLLAVLYLNINGRKVSYSVGMGLIVVSLLMIIAHVKEKITLQLQ